MKSIFICHRPYHILRSCDIIKKNCNKDCENILFTYDVKLEKKQEYQRFETHRVFYSYFDEVVELTRQAIPSIKDLLNYFVFCKSLRKQYRKYVTKYHDVDVIYFYADDELEIELLVGLFLEYNPKIKSILIDEGLVTYSAVDHKHFLKVRLWLRIFKFFAGIKYFNIEQNYGYSNLYNLSLANNPEKAIYFHKPIDKLPALSEEICKEVRGKITSKKVPDSSNPYFIYVGTYEKSFYEDLPVIEQMRAILSKYGLGFYIKLHPQQNESLYLKQFGDQVLLEKGIPVELFFGHNAIMAGTISSSLFNASLQGYFAMDVSFLFPEKERKKWMQMPMSQQFDWIDVKPVSSFSQFESLIKLFLSSI